MMESTLFSHPVSDQIRTRVLDELARIEERHDVHVLFACESGSRAWGFASPDSDYDVRFLYVHKLDWYLRVASQRDVIELPIDDELDISGWELRKAMGLMTSSNPTLFEWFDSPIIYRQDDAATQALKTLGASLYSPLKGRWHYLSMAKKNFREYLQGDTVRLKKYLYVLRPLLAAQWLDSGRGVPPMRFADLADAMVASDLLKQEINALLAIKMTSGEAKEGPPFPRIQQFIVETLQEDKPPQGYKQPSGDVSQLDRLLFDLVTSERTLG